MKDHANHTRPKLFSHPKAPRYGQRGALWCKVNRQGLNRSDLVCCFTSKRPALA
ncbi:hypothetical protein HanIR_Chr11g0554451 [Helianthus annuus]|nr:hypothetical protein HanIR_Chr11g0554451 [Helianthus annuus]